MEPVKSLYTDNYEVLTDDGMKVSKELYAAISPIIEKYANEGCSVRDLSHIALHELMLIEAIVRLRLTIDIRKAEENAKRKI